MSNSTEKFENLIKDLEQNLENKKDLEYVKKAVSEFLNNKNDSIEKKMLILEEGQRELEFKINKIDEVLKKIEEDLYIDEEEDENFEFEVVCPYCNYTFNAQLDELKEYITCPECNNIIELDWNQEESQCSGCCSCCHDSEELDFEEDEEDYDDDM